jgi:plasmid stabilization system protein ParE
VDCQIRITQEAVKDFEEILAYSAAHFPETTEQFCTSLLNHLDLLRAFPSIGSRISQRSKVRQLLHTPILIYYRVHEESNIVEILHFWHASRHDPQL